MSIQRLKGKNLKPKVLKSEFTYLFGEWVRNPSWLALPSVSYSDEKFAGLYMINESANFIALQANTSTGSYYVDWGDGTNSTVSSGVSAYKEYDYTNSAFDNTNAPVTFTDSSDTVNRTAHGYTDGMTVWFASITTTTGISPNVIYYVVNATADTFQIAETEGGSPISLTNDGTGFLLPYKQAVVTVTPVTGGATLRGINLNIKHNQSGLVSGYANGWLDIAYAGAGDNVVSFSGSSGSTISSNLQQARIVRCGATTGSSLFSSCHNLISIPEITFTTSPTSLNQMFFRCFSLITAPEMNTSAVTNMSQMFDSCYSLVNVPTYDTSSVTGSTGSGGMTSMFANCTSLVNAPFLKTSSVVNMTYMFSNCYSLKNVPCYDMSSVTGTTTSGGTSYMFQNCTSLTSVPKFNTSSVVNMNSMFFGCSSLETVPELDTSSVTGTSTNGGLNGFLSGCRSLTSVPLFNTTNVVNMAGMFQNCSSIVEIPKFNTPNVLNFSSTFNNCSTITTIPELNTSSATNFSSMFSNCSSLRRVPNLNTSSATNMTSMFQGCASLLEAPILTTTSVTTFANMFNGCSSLRYVPAYSVAATTASSAYSTMFSTCYSLIKCDMAPKYTFTISLCKLSGTELNNVYTNLPTVTSQTITVTSNYGTTSDDPTIATAKGWTVTGS